MALILPNIEEKDELLDKISTVCCRYVSRDVCNSIGCSSCVSCLFSRSDVHLFKEAIELNNGL